MGWCSGTEVFDSVVGKVLNYDLDELNKIDLIVDLIKSLQDNDWDCEYDSDYWQDPTVRQAFKIACPKWDWDDIEADEKGK